MYDKIVETQSAASMADYPARDGLGSQNSRLLYSREAFDGKGPRWSLNADKISQLEPDGKPPFLTG
jgi:hypothetical protein